MGIDIIELSGVIMNCRYFSVITLSSLCFIQSAYPTKNFSNAGVLSGNRVSLEVTEEINNAGKITAREKIELICQSLTGNGTMSAPEIAMHVGKFNFQGTIECSKKCIILAREPFDENCFKRIGGGEFEIRIDSEASSVDKIVERVVRINDLTFTFKGTDSLELIKTIEENNLDALQAIFEYKPDISAQVVVLAMMFAGSLGHIAIVKELIKCGANINGDIFFDVKPLIVAVKQKNSEFFDILMSCGANPNVYDERHRSPLAFAANLGYIERVKKLIAAGALPLVRDFDGLTPLDAARMNGKWDIVKLLSSIAMPKNDLGLESESNKNKKKTEQCQDDPMIRSSDTKNAIISPEDLDFTKLKQKLPTFNCIYSREYVFGAVGLIVWLGLPWFRAQIKNLINSIK